MVTRTSTPEGFDLLPGNIDLTAAEIQLMDQGEREQRLKRALAPVRDEYDFILIDCPPALSLLTLNALAAADSVIVPMQCEYYALEGLSALVETIEALRANLNPTLEIEGVLRTMFDVRNNLANAVSAELTDHFGDRVFRTIVPRNVRLAEAPSHGQSIVGYDRASRGGVAYLGLAGEIIRRHQQRNKADKALVTCSTPWISCLRWCRWGWALAASATSSAPNCGASTPMAAGAWCFPVACRRR